LPDSAFDPCWRVADIADTMRGLTAKGVEFAILGGLGQSESGVWAAPGGDRIAWFRDPDGNTLSLTEFASG